MIKLPLISKVRVTVLALSIAVLCGVWGAQNVLAASEPTPATAKEAMKISQDTNEYCFLLFYDNKDSLYDQMKQAVTNFTSRSDQKILVYESARSSGTDAALIAQYR